MNAKKSKNKQKQNKPANPQPKTETEIVDKENVTSEDVKEEIPVSGKVEERVPEIVSEIVTPVEPKAAESDTPKKPKRNRGKKKKSDKEDDFDDEHEQNPIEKVEVTTVSEEKNDKALDITEKPAGNVPEVTPVARKKKNKNKKQSEQTGDKSDQEIKITQIKSVADLTDVKIVTLVPVLTDEESKAGKKKNKKKKRNDSERSEKAEEVISCTAAFQKLLEVKNDNKMEIKVDKTEENLEDKPSTEVKEIAKEEIFVDTPKMDTVSEDTTKNVSMEEVGKSKKKNKKEKKFPKSDIDDESQKSTEIKSEPVLFEPPVLSTEIKTPEPISKALTEKNDQILENIPILGEVVTEKEKAQPEVPVIEKERSPKAKAKIAKPVDKKRKGKPDTSSSEDLLEVVQESESAAIKQEEKLIVQELPTEAELKPKDLPVSKKESQLMLSDLIFSTPTETKESEVVLEPTEIKEELILIPHEKETIPKPESMGKKRKKSPKPKPAEHTDAKKADVQIVEHTEVKTHLEEHAIGSTDAEKSLDIKPIQEAIKEIAEASLAPIKLYLPKSIPVVHSEQISELPEVKPSVSNEPETTFAVPNIAIPLGFSVPLVEPTQTKILKTPDIDKMTEKQKENVLKETKETEKLPMPETEPRKKRKKSPKLPRKFESVPEPIKETAEIINENVQDIPPPPPFPKEFAEEFKEKQDFISDLPPLEDIEIRSIKTEESEGSSCEMAPDVQYPRASSQLMDNNNNKTVIREIKTSDVKLDIPIALPDTPFVQGSGEVPMVLPEFVPEIKLTETETSLEKPDQKDKLIKEKVEEKEVKEKKLVEKTDLKSKVLDVNQGMEELRRSIERSLAELSAIEKNEKDAEDQFARAQHKLEEITEMASKKIEDSRKEREKASCTPKNVETVIKDTTPMVEKDIKHTKIETQQEVPVTTNYEESKSVEQFVLDTPISLTPPVCPARKDNKGKGKKKKGKHDAEQISAPSAVTTAESSATVNTTTSLESKETTQDPKKEEKTEQKTDTAQEKTTQQSASFESDEKTSDTKESETTDALQVDFQPIENFEDALTSSADDVNKTFEMIVNEPNETDQSQNPEINITEPIEEDEKGDTKDEQKINPVSQPKNLLGHPDIPARLNKTDYKKEKNKTPNTRQAKVKIKDDVPVEITKESKESQTESKRRFFKDKSVTETISSVVNENEEYIYKYSFRKVFLPSACHICKKDLKEKRVPCNFCNLVFYCSQKHKDEDYPQHQALCFAVATIVHLKNQKHIYGDAQNITGQDYRLLRMQMIISCEKVLKRRLVPWEQEALLYPRICAEPECREWRQGKLVDCEGCAQVSYCSEHPTHLPKTHQRWCKSYSLYHKLVVYQQTRGRLEPRLPSRVVADLFLMPGKLNEVLAAMYEEKIDMTDIQYAALTQIATAPLTAAFCQQLYISSMNSSFANGVQKKSSFTIHVVGAELQFEADALNKWEVFFLHLRPDVKDLRVVLIAPDLNPSKLPLDLLAKIKMCDNCRQNKRRVVFDFQDKKSYYEYWSTEYIAPDLVCAFNPSIQRSSVFNGKDSWPASIKCIMKLKVPFIITAHTLTELQRDMTRIKECADGDVSVISDAKFNAFASVRPDRNFISDDEMPLLFKNFCFAIVCGSL